MTSSGKRSLRVAIIGTRGVPARYGGFETFAAELSRRLVERGHLVTVYGRKGIYPEGDGDWEGVTRVHLPALQHKYFETVSHAFLSSLDALRRSFDVALVCNAANAFVLPILGARRIPTAINVDGIERKRKKWNALGRLVYMAGETMSVDFASRVVADAEVIADYYRKQLGVEAEVIPYGAEFPEEADSDILEKLGIRPRGYILYVSRLEPENNPLAVVEAYQKVSTAIPLVMIGDAPYSTDLIRTLKAKQNERTLMPGAIYGADYRTLQRNALFYVQATEVGGTHPAMIEAMASGGAVLANDTPENREVGGDAVGYFRVGEEETLAARMHEWSGSSDLDEWRRRAHERAKRYSWDAVTDAYEELFGELAR